MAYVKQTWVNLPDKTTPISAERLNHIEDGVEAAEESSNKVTSVSSSSTDAQYPSAKLFYDTISEIQEDIGDIGDALDDINREVVE